METKERFRERLAELFNSQKLAALSTQKDGQPYASLVAFHAADDARHIYFVTPKTTRKFANLCAENRVAVMINNSTNRDSDFHEAISVTAVGKAHEVTGADKDRVLSHYLAKHPFLEDFARAKTSALVGVRVKSYFMVRNFQIVTELHMQA
jgi:nitroimidazol reductase NimA-like FMN-containing flavoprotein (pyridoxamine 5'-phosphate oxidase superfamily)